MKKYILVGFFVVIFAVGLGVIFSTRHIGFDEIMRSLGDLNPRVLGLIALPFIVLLFFLGVYLRRKNEERKWKQALLKTRARKLSR